MGSHTVSETSDPNYTAVIGGDCAATGSITLAAGDVKTCTITNTFKAPKLTVKKLVDNTGGGTKQPGDFPLFVDGTPVTNNQRDHHSTVGPHTVSETTDPNHTAVIGGDCAANELHHAGGGRRLKTCTITNTFKAPKLHRAEARGQYRRRHQAARRLPALRRRHPVTNNQQITSTSAARTR